MEKRTDEIKYLEGQIAALQILAARQVVSYALTSDDPEKMINSCAGLSTRMDNEHADVADSFQPFKAGMVDCLRVVMDAALSSYRQHIEDQRK
ncbi:hypothetical protein [Alcaligenes phenolicus]|uniref:hypothetical protein n=1 Tax=Alcaligenes TaxID=507 RepID=UPI0009F588E6|nr:hypothetical protein [Alcaligenes phenolicus]OQV33585.1 hypothetical protein BV899_05880 [Alcaligenes phenolicus]